MATKTYAGQAVEISDEGYMVDASQWSREVATEMAKEEGIEFHFLENAKRILGDENSKVKAMECLMYQ